MTKLKTNPQKLLNQQLSDACAELEYEVLNAIPENSGFGLYHVKNQHRRKGYSLARQINPLVANGITVVLLTHSEDQIELFAAVCSPSDTYSRLDGRKEVLSRVHQKYVKGIIDPQRPSYTYTVDPSAKHSDKIRTVINLFIKDELNSRIKPKAPVFAPVRSEVLAAEAALLEVLKKSNPNSLDYRLIYKHEASTRSETTTLKAVVAKTEHNSGYAQDVIDEFEKQSAKLTVEVNRYHSDPSNRLSARWYAVKKMLKALKKFK